MWMVLEDFYVTHTAMIENIQYIYLEYNFVSYSSKMIILITGTFLFRHYQVLCVNCSVCVSMLA